MADITRYFDPEQPSKKRQKIKIKGSKEFADKVEKMLNDWVYYSYVGRQVLKEIWSTSDGRMVTIQFQENIWTSVVADDPNTAEDEESNQFAKDHKYGMKFMDVAVGTGKGASPTLSYDPDTKAPQNACSSGNCPTPRFILPRFVLFHELVHSMRQMKGCWMTGSVTLNKKPTTLEEGVAIVLTNMLMSEKGDNTLRADHTSLDTIGCDPYTFVQDADAKKILARIKADHGGLYTYLKTLKTSYFPFNPIYALEGN